MSRSSQKQHPVSLQGIGASPGIVIAPVLIMDTQRRGHHRRYGLTAEQAPAESARFERAVNIAELELLLLRDRCDISLENAVAIINAHLLMLRDKMLFERTINIIHEELANAEWSLNRSIGMIKSALGRINDPYLRERSSDIDHVGERIFKALEGRERHSFANLQGRVIIAAHDFSPEDLIAADTGKIAGLLTEKGGVTSHTAIVARSLGIPSVVAVENVIGQLRDVETLILDGDSGRAILNPTAETRKQYQEYQRQNEAFDEENGPTIPLGCQ